MDQAMLWITFIGIIIIPLAGGLVNTIVTKKIDAITEDLKETKKSFYQALNSQRASFEDTLRDYVRKDMYDQAIELHRINNEEKFKSLLSVVTTQYTNLEYKINENNINMNEKISGLKSLINEKFNSKKNGPSTIN